MEQGGLTSVSGMPATNSSVLKNESEILELNHKEAFGGISFGLGCVIVAINIVSLACLIRHRRHVSGAGLWQQLLFLCVTDILTDVAISVFTLGSFFLFKHPSIHDFFCVTGIFLFPLSITLSAGNCCIISILRYISVRTLNKQVKKWDKRTSLFMILSNILICLVTVIGSVAVVTIRFGFHPKEFCDMINSSGQNEYKESYIIGGEILLVLFLLCTNTFTSLSIIKLTKLTNAQSTRRRENVSNSNSQSSTETALNSLIQKYRYTTETFILIAFVLNLTNIPTLLFVLVSISHNVTVPAEITEIISRMMCMNSLLNPFIYSLRMSSFRKAGWNDIRAVCARLKCSGCGTIRVHPNT